jgi:hypothetical protein
MKIAVCLSGQVRTAIQAAPNILRYLKDILPETDFFIHTWDINQYRNHGEFNGEIPEHRKGTISLKDRPIIPVSSGDLAQYEEIYKPKIMRVEPYDRYDMLYNPAQHRRHPVLHYTWRKSVLYCLEYCIQKNLEYDVIIKMRPDVVYPSTRNMAIEIENFLKDPEAMYFDNCNEDVIDDVLWLGNQKNTLLLSNFGDPALEMQPNFMMRDFIRLNRIKFKPMVDKGYAPLRPENSHFDVLTQFGNIFYYDHYWYADGPPLKWPAEE